VMWANSSQVYSFWRISPLEFVIWAATVLVTVFSSIENGIYASLCASLALFLIRLAHQRGSFLGKAIIRGHTSDAQDVHEVFLPLDMKAPADSHINIIPPSPGVLVYRFEDSFVYPNCALATDQLIDYVKEHTRRGQDLGKISPGDRPWNDPGPRKGEIETNKPSLHAIVLDFSAVLVPILYQYFTCLYLPLQVSG
jgi:sodium-independent sulfate anion transporter 11